MAMVLLLGALIAGWACSSTPVFVDDRAALLSATEQDRLSQMCRALLEDLDIHILTVILASSPADLDAEAVTVFENARLGAQTGAARGLLFLVDPTGGRVRLEVGYDLEAVFTDAFVGYIERSQMVPFFQAGRVGAGVEATVELLVGRAMGDDRFAETTADRSAPQDDEHLSGGAGARTDVEIGAGSASKKTSARPGEYTAQSTPQATLDAYMQVLRRHVTDPELGIYTDDTRAFFRRWLVTAAQQDNELNKLESTRGSQQTLLSGDLAVIRFPLGDRQACPYFFRRGARGWMLDFAAMSRWIGFNHKNQWFFRATEHPFMFAFDDVVFDGHGFPHPPPG
jgi:hypothetical protein